MRVVAALSCLALLAGAFADDTAGVPPPFPASMPEWMHPGAGPDGKIPVKVDYSSSKNPCADEYKDKGCMPKCWSEFKHCVEGL